MQRSEAKPHGCLELLSLEFLYDSNDVEAQDSKSSGTTDHSVGKR